LQICLNNKTKSIKDDILFDLLTVEEQIEFHAIARGLIK
jgi:hypothetical protein